MYEFCVNCARILWNVDKDLLALPIYASICWSASTGTYLYLFASSGVFAVFALSLLSCGAECSEAERGRS